MAKVFIGIALIVMLATAALGFLAKGNIDKLKSTLTETKGKIAAAEGAARAAKADAETAKKEATAANDKATAETQKAETATKAAEDAKKAAEEGKVVIEGKDKEIADLNVKIKGMGNGITPEDLAKAKAEAAEATAQRDAAMKEAESGKIAAERLQAQGLENVEKVKDLQKKLLDRERNYQKPGLKGSVLAVNSGWNFVVLSVGDKQGVVINATLLVVRGNEPVARLRITSVEPSTSIADVMPGTVRRGVNIQPGDTVIFEGTRNATPAAGPKAAEPTIPPITPPATAPLPNS